MLLLLVLLGVVTTRVLSVREATYARDSFAKTLYGLLFKWILARINLALSHSSSSHSQTQGQGQQRRPPAASQIGVLDIFGFEFFDSHNSLEQLLSKRC